MSKFFRRLLIVMTGFAFLFGLSQVPAQAATTSDVGILATREDCTSNHYHAVGSNLRVYMGYSNVSGGRNCAWLEKTSGTGTTTYMGIVITKCAAGNYNGQPSCPIGTQDGQSGNFYTYVGPVTVTGTNGRCIWVRIHYNGSNWYNPFGIHHCG